MFIGELLNFGGVRFLFEKHSKKHWTLDGAQVSTAWMNKSWKPKPKGQPPLRPRQEIRDYEEITQWVIIPIRLLFLGESGFGVVPWGFDDKSFFGGREIYEVKSQVLWLANAFFGVHIACHDGNDRCWNWTASPNFHKHSERRPFITGSPEQSWWHPKHLAIKNRHAHGGWFEDVDVLHIKPAVPVGPLFHRFASLRAKPRALRRARPVAAWQANRNGFGNPSMDKSFVASQRPMILEVRGIDRNTYAETSPPPVHFLHVASTRFCSMAFLWMMGYQRSVLPDQAP